MSVLSLLFSLQELRQLYFWIIYNYTESVYMSFISVWNGVSQL